MSVRDRKGENRGKISPIIFMCVAGFRVLACKCWIGRQHLAHVFWCLLTVTAQVLSEGDPLIPQFFLVNGGVAIRIEGGQLVHLLPSIVSSLQSEFGSPPPSLTLNEHQSIMIQAQRVIPSHHKLIS